MSVTAPSTSSTSSTDTAPPTSSTALYSDRPPRIAKEDLFMVLALWMELLPVKIHEDLREHTGNAKRQKLHCNSRHHNVGAVLVLPNDILYAVDCTRGGVHAVARLLMKHPDIAKGCKVFVSRKPCSFCTKLLVQSKVERVFFPPFEPEYRHDISHEVLFQQEISEVDTLFTRSSIGQSVFVPKVEKAVLEHEYKRLLKETNVETSETKKEQVGQKRDALFQQFWGPEDGWMQTENVKKNLPWKAFDEPMKNHIKSDFRNNVEWMAIILVESGLDTDNFSFQNVRPPQGSNGSQNEYIMRQQAAHLIRMAQFLARRTDDPKAGVGAVIANQSMEIKALGWNGFPLKALYGEFPRASSKDEVKEKKFPFVIHAEQNAFLMRNNKKLGKDATLFVTRTPCDECTPLIQMQGIKTVVLGQKMERDKPGNLSYEKFPQSVKKGVFTCFEMKPPPSKSPSLPSSCYFNCCCGFCF